MGLGATLAGHRVTDGKLQISKWGCAYADVQLDGEHEVSGPVELVFADLTVQCSVLSSRPVKGRTFARLVGGKGGWANTIPEKSYVDDAGVRARTVLDDAAREAGEVFDSTSVSSDTRLGPSWTRPAGPAIDVLDLIAPRGWYVGEDGITRLGARTGSEISPKIPRIKEADHASANVVLAADSIATLLPGVTVDGLTAVDVEHKISAKGGLRTTVYGAREGGSTRALDAFASLLDAVDPGRKFRGVVEYRVVTLSGERLDLQPVRASLGMPDLDLAVVRPGVPGCKAETALGSYVLVGFVNSDPARPYVAAFEDPDGDGFQPTSLSLLAGDSAGGEHLMTVEACALLIYNVFYALSLTVPAPAGVGVLLQPFITPAILAAMTAQSAPAPPGLVAQIATAAALTSGMTTGTVPSNATGPLAAGLTALSTKTPNVSTLFPSLGCPAVKAG